MKRVVLLICLLPIFSFTDGQARSPNFDSLRRLLGPSTHDTTSVLLSADISFNYAFWDVDSSIAYAQKAINLARQLQYTKGEAAGMLSYGWALWASGNYDKAIEAALKSL